MNAAVEDNGRVGEGRYKGVNTGVVEGGDAAVLCRREARKQGLAGVQDEGGREGGREGGADGLEEGEKVIVPDVWGMRREGGRERGREGKREGGKKR